jgi:hypothetical protein
MAEAGEIISARFESRGIKNLDYLVRVTKKTRSIILREVVPPKYVIDSLCEMAVWQRRSTNLLTKDLFDFFCLNTLDSFMRRDREHPIGPQIDIYCAGLDPEIKTAQLFLRWARAKQGVEGYLFAKCFYGDRDFTFVYGPDDDGEKIKAAILDYAEKLYSPLPPLLIGGKEIK